MSPFVTSALSEREASEREALEREAFGRTEPARLKGSPFGLKSRLA